jgi:hypothetical protein
MMNTGKAFKRSRPAASLHRSSATEDAIETIVTYPMSSAPEMHTAESKAGTKTGNVKSKNNVMKGTMIIMVLTMTNLIGKG